MKKHLLTIAIMICMICGFATTTSAVGVGQTAKVSGREINLLASPRTSNVIVDILENGDIVWITGSYGKYWKVRAYKSGNDYKNVYVLKSQVRDYSIDKYGYITKNLAQIYKGASTTSEKLAKIKTGAKVKQIRKYKGFTKISITSGGRTCTGWILSIYLQEKNAEYIDYGYVNYEYLRLRSKPNTNCDVVVKLSYMDRVDVIGKCVDGWWMVHATHGNNVYEGFVLGAYISK